jgi:hypothetical protein
MDEETKKQVRATLVKDKQIPDTSFKALAAGVLVTLGKKLPVKPEERSPIKSQNPRPKKRRAFSWDS